MSNVGISFESVDFSFSGQQSLFVDLSLEIVKRSSDGWIVVLMGPSGVGKTTLCDMALGLLKPRSGKVSVSPRGGHLAAIPQRGVVFEDLSIRENVGCLKHSRTLGDSFREERVGQAIKCLGLERVLSNGTPAKSLSGGEAQRVMLARIQTVDCDILFLDEPCSYLDNRMKGEFLDALRTTIKSGDILTVLVTHLWEEAEYVADEIVYLDTCRGERVNVFRMTPERFSVRPPTLDALYSVHWPRCMVVDKEQLSKWHEQGRLHVPPAAEYGGLYEAGEIGDTEHDVLEVVPGSEGDGSAEEDGRSKLEPRRMRYLFYDASGQLID